jgi:hypothetical protein
MGFEFDDVNLDKAVDEINGKGAKLILDERMATPWTFSRKETAFAVELVNADAEMLGEGIECTKLRSIPIEINPKDKSYELLTRPESRGVVSNIFHQFQLEADDGGSVASMTGSPGIGKSWTLFYALQQALLYDGATVLFFFQKEDQGVLFLRRNNNIYAWTSTSRLYANSNLFRIPEVLVLLDPTEAIDGGARFRLGKMKLLYAASNNRAHFKNAAEKNNGKMQAILGPPLDKELQVILARLGPQLEQKDIEERKQTVGNLFRYILDKDKYEIRKEVIKINVEACADKPKLLERAVLANAYSDGENTIPGTLFQMWPKRPKTVGYDGQNVKYRERIVQAATDNVRNAILKAGRKAILSYFGKVSSAERAKMGDAVEALFIEDLMNPDGTNVGRRCEADDVNEHLDDNANEVVPTIHLESHLDGTL